MSNKDIKPIARKSNVVVQDYANEVLIYDLTENKAFSLNETSAIIWQLCDGTRTVSEIAANLSGKLNSSISDDFVWLALEQMKKDALLENAEEISADFGELSRREVIRKIGFTTLVALPMISSLIAPMAIHATSSSTPSTACQQSRNPATDPTCQTPSTTYTRPAGCTCAPGSGAGTVSGADSATPPVSTCGTGLRCFSGKPLTYSGAPTSPGMGNACCTTATNL